MKHVLEKLKADRQAQRVLLAVILGFAVGTIWLLGLRFLMQKDTHTHYHANFALYVNGQRDPFENFAFYEEVASCGGNDVSNPKLRVHMHKPDAHVVHTHDEAVTWGHFFANLGYTLGNDVLKTDAGIFIDGQDGRELRFMLNGEEVQGVANRTINDQDALLVSYGSADAAAMQQQYDSIPRDAARFNETADPAACSGAEELTFSERLRRTFDFTR